MPSAVRLRDLSCDTRSTNHDSRDDDGWNVIAEVKNNGQIKTKYVHGPRVDEILAQKKNNTLYLTRDGLGSTRELIKDDAKISQRFDYDAFGAVTVLDKNGAVIPDAPKTNCLFTGREFQPESGLYNYRNRFYHPGVGRFLQTDPVGIKAGDINIYTYVGNNPVILNDPFGLFNYVKAAVGSINIGRGVFKVFTGVPKVALGAPVLVAAPETGPLAPFVVAGAGLVTASGIADIAGAFFLVKRGSKQLGEASADPCPGHLKNLIGLLPFGQHFDDPGENLHTAVEEIKRLPLIEQVGELFTF